MITTTIMGILAVLFAYLTRYRNVKYGLKISFILIFIFLALRYMFGNDYIAYLNVFEEINDFNEYDFFERTNRMEIGWLFLCRLFRPFGFFAMIAVLAVFNSVIYYNFIKKYVPIELYWFAVFIYVFSPGFMLTQLTAMRQSLSILVFIFSLDYLFKKEAIRFFLCVGLATLFHNSAIILIPIYFIGFFNWRINKFTAFIIFSIFISLFYFSSYFSNYLTDYIGIYFKLYFDTYSDFEPATIDSGLGVLYLSILFVLTIYYEKFQNRETALVFKIAIISFMFIPLGMLLLFFGRIEMYFSIGLIIAYPLIFKGIKSHILKLMFSTILILITLYTYFLFFNSEVYRKSFETYQTIFSAEKIY